MVNASVTVESDDRRAIQRQLDSLIKRVIEVGISEETNMQGVGEGEIGNAAKAYINDVGAPELNIPQREFMRPGVERETDQIKTSLYKTAQAHLDQNEQGVRDNMAHAGQAAVNGIREEIYSGDLNPGGRELSPVTLKLRKEIKNFDGEEPLIVSGTMIQALTYVIDGGSNAVP